MDIDALRYFLMVAREENITGASEVLHISQPTLSRQMMQLEQEVGAKLLIRTNHNVTLTEEGFLFRRRAQDVVSLIEKAKDEVSEKEETISGTIAIGCGELRSVSELAGILSSFQAKFPRVKYELFSGSNEEIQEKLEQGTLDAALFLQPFNAEAYDYIDMKTKEIWGVLVHKDLELADRDVVRPGELVGTLVITVRIGTAVQRELARWSGEYAKDMDYFANYNVLHNAVVIARQRKGVVICIESDFTYEDMKFIPFEPVLSFGSLLAWKRDTPSSKTRKAFLEFVRSAI